jgi:hypothetical protein
VFWEGEEREEILKIRRGETPKESALAQIKHLFDVIETNKLTLPRKADTNLLSKWLIELKCTELQQTLTSVKLFEIPNLISLKPGAILSEIASIAINALKKHNIPLASIICIALVGSHAHHHQNTTRKNMIIKDFIDLMISF